MPVTLDKKQQHTIRSRNVSNDYTDFLDSCGAPSMSNHWSRMTKTRVCVGNIGSCLKLIEEVMTLPYIVLFVVCAASNLSIILQTVEKALMGD